MKKTTIAYAAGLLALLACSSDHLTKVTFATENALPPTVTFTGAGVSVPTGIGLAFVVTLYINNNKTSDTASVTIADPLCNLSPGINANEFFIVCDTPGTSSLVFSDTETGDQDDGTISIPITVTPQAGSMPFPDGGFVVPDSGTTPPVDGATPETGVPDATSTEDAESDGATD